MTTAGCDESVRRHFIYLDLGFYAACNLKCAYCRSSIVRDRGEFTLQDLIEQVEAFLARYRAAVVKISGYGEVTMWRDFERSLDYLSRRFPRTQVISNGTFPRSVAEMIVRRSDVSPNITLDGHTLELNATRVGPSKRLHDRILANIDFLVEHGCRIEINCVLHERNMDGLLSFAEYLMRYPERSVVLLPFPAKSFERAPGVGSDIRGRMDSLGARLHGAWDSLRTVLPPKPYWDALADFLLHGSRVKPCHVHWVNLGTGAKNERLHCPNYGEELSYGPIVETLTTRADEVDASVAGRVTRGHVGPRCAECFNHFDVLNLYLEGKMSLDDLRTLPSLDHREAAEIAVKVRREFHEQIAAVAAAEGASTISATARHESREL
jgi:pyruvate-formate lyase-activating enzyme